MAFKMAGYTFPGTPNKQNNDDDDSLNVHASITDMEKTPEGRKKLAELREKSQSRVLSGANKQLASPSKQKKKSWIGEKLSNLDKKLSKKYTKEQEEKWGKSDATKYNRDGTLRKQG